MMERKNNKWGRWVNFGRLPSTVCTSHDIPFKELLATAAKTRAQCSKVCSFFTVLSSRFQDNYSFFKSP